MIKINFLKLSEIFFFLVILGFCAYGNSIFHPFVHDDIVFIQNNPNIADLSDIPSLFSESAWVDDDLEIKNSYYRPFLEILTRLQYRIFGLNPHGFHFFNILIHILNSFLVFLVLFRLTERKEISLACAAFFLIHPVQTQAVACISGVSNLIYGLFLLLSFYFYLRLRDNKTSLPTGSIYGLSLLFFVLALLAKEQAVILPLLLVLYELSFPHSKRLLSRRLSQTAGFFGMSVAYFLIREFLFGSVSVSLFTYRGELWLRSLSIPKTILQYWEILLFPRNLHYYRVVDFLEPVAGSIIFFLVVLSGLGFCIYRIPKDRRRLPLFAAGWFFVTLLPTLNFLPLIIEYSLLSNAEHFLYLPSIGFLLFVIVTAEYFFKSVLKVKDEKTALAAATIIGIIFVGGTIKQNRIWRGEIPLFERTVQLSKPIGRVYLLLGQAYFDHQQYDKAIAAFDKAASILNGYLEKVTLKEVRDYYFHYIKRIYFLKGQSYAALGDFNRSLANFQEAVHLDPHNAGIHNNLGISYMLLKNHNQAIIHFKKAVEIDEKDVRSLNNLALCYIEKENYREAERLLEQAVRTDPNFIAAKQNLERLKARENRR